MSERDEDEGAGVVHAGELTREEVAHLRERWEASYRGTGNSGYTPLTLSPWRRVRNAVYRVFMGREFYREGR